MTQQINLYNPAFKPKRQLLTAPSLALGTVVLAVLVGATATWAQLDARARTAAMVAAQAEQKAAQEAFDAARRAAESRKPSQALQAEIATRKAQLAMRDEVLAALKDGLGDESSRGAGFSEYLRGLGRQTVNGLWLTRFSVSAGGADMALQGRALDKSLLPDYVRRLNGERAFAGKSFAGLRMEAKQDAAARPAEVRTTAPATVPAALTSATSRPAAWIDFNLAAAATPAEGAKP